MKDEYEIDGSDEGPKPEERKNGDSADDGGDDNKKGEDDEEDEASEDDNSQHEDMEKGPPIDETRFLKKAPSRSGDVEDRTVTATEDRSKDDVLCGRGIPFQKWPGNQRMRRIVQKHRQEYAGAKRHEKGVIVQRVIQEIKEGGARFLHPLGGDNAQDEVEHWVEAKNEYVYEKVSHAMRQKKRKPIRAKSTKSLSSSSQGMSRQVRTGGNGVESSNETSLQARQTALPVGLDVHTFANPAAAGSRGVAGMHSTMTGLGGLPVTHMFQSSIPPLPTTQGWFTSPADVPSPAGAAGDELQKLLRIEQLRRQQLNIQMMRRDELLLQLQIDEIRRRNATGTGQHQQPSNEQSILQLLNTSGIQQERPQQQIGLASNQNATAASASVAALNSVEDGRTNADVSSGGGTNMLLPSDMQALHRQLLEGHAGSGTHGVSSLLGGINREIMAPAAAGNTLTFSSSGAISQSLGPLSGLSQQQIELLRLLELQQQQRNDSGS